MEKGRVNLDNKSFFHFNYYFLIIDSFQCSFGSRPNKSVTVAATLDNPKLSSCFNSTSAP